MTYILWHTYLHTYIQACRHVGMHACMHACIHTFIRMYIFFMCVYDYLYIYIHTYAYHMYMHMCMCVRVGMHRWPFPQEAFPRGSKVFHCPKVKIRALRMPVTTRFHFSWLGDSTARIQVISCWWISLSRWFSIWHMGYMFHKMFIHTSQKYPHVS